MHLSTFKLYFEPLCQQQKHWLVSPLIIIKLNICIPLPLQHLRTVGVVGKFVEFFGEGVAHLSIADRATIANMCPEYGATVGYFPVDEATLGYLRQTGRSLASGSQLGHTELG